jgi:hypothetical protein
VHFTEKWAPVVRQEMRQTAILPLSVFHDDSVMIAALGVAGHLVADDHLEDGVIVVEIMLYLLVAVACLRCMAIFDEHSVAHDPALVSTAVRDELILRRELYNICSRATIFLTVLIFISLPLLYLYVPKR